MSAKTRCVGSVGRVRYEFGRSALYAAYLLNANLTGEVNSGESGNQTINRNNMNTVDYGVAGGLNLFFSEVLIGYGQGLTKVANRPTPQLLFGHDKMPSV